MLGTESTFCLLEQWFPVSHREPLGTRGSSAQAAAIHSWCAISFLFLIYKRFKKQNKTKKWCSLETLPGRLGSPATVPHPRPSPFWGTRNPQTVSFSPPFCGQWALPLLPLADGTTITKNLTLLGAVGGQGPLWGRDTDNFSVAEAETAGSPLPGG